MQHNPLPTGANIRFMRLPEVLARYPVSRSSWWRGIKTGQYPKPYKLSANVTAWLESDIEAFLQSLANQQGIGNE